MTGVHKLFGSEYEYYVPKVKAVCSCEILEPTYQTCDVITLKTKFWIFMVFKT
jgi:hypothetical protein